MNYVYYHYKLVGSSSRLFFRLSSCHWSFKPCEIQKPAKDKSFPETEPTSSYKPLESKGPTRGNKERVESLHKRKDITSTQKLLQKIQAKLNPWKIRTNGSLNAIPAGTQCHFPKKNQSNAISLKISKKNQKRKTPTSTVGRGIIASRTTLQ